MHENESTVSPKIRNKQHPTAEKWWYSGFGVGCRLTIIHRESVVLRNFEKKKFSELYSFLQMMKLTFEGYVAGIVNLYPR
jgi:hypothetical protein